MKARSIYVTSKGLKSLLNKRDELYDKLRSIQSQKAEAADIGGDGWHDNFAFEDLTRQEMMVNKQISDLKNVLERAVVVSDISSSEVLTIGHIVTLRDVDTNREEIYQVGGYNESDLTVTPPLIAYNSPILINFFHQKVGHISVVQRAGQEMELELVDFKRGKLL